MRSRKCKLKSDWRAGGGKRKKGKERDGKKLKGDDERGAKVKKGKMKKERKKGKELKEEKVSFLAEMGGCCLAGIEQNFGEGAERSNGRVWGG